MVYQLFKKDLKDKGYIFNPYMYDPCVADKVINKLQHTVKFNIDALDLQSRGSESQ